MKTFYFQFLFILLSGYVGHSQGVAINQTNAEPNASAMLDIQSNAKGILIPRMTSAERIAIATPAVGLLVFDTNTASFWFRHSSGWKELTDDFHGLRDMDNDTKVQVEESPDEDIIRFDIGGDEALVINKSSQGATRLDVGPQLGLIIGRNAGLSSFSGWNTMLGPNAGQFNTTGQNNVFVGYRAGEDNGSQDRNVFVGNESGANNLGSFNTFAGYRSGYVNTTGNSNVFVGHESGVQNTTGIRNTFVGYFAGHNNEVTNENTFIGFSSGYNNEGNRNTFLGYEAGLANRTGQFNTIIGGEAAGTNLNNRDMGNGNSIVGYEAAQTANGMTENVLMGYRSGYNMLNGLRNILIGPHAGFTLSTAYSNVAVGPSALRLNMTGIRNVAMGDSSLYATVGSANTALGFRAGMNNAAGSANVFIGYRAGYENEGGHSNIHIGPNAGSRNENGNYNIAIGDLALGHQGDSPEDINLNIAIGRQAGENIIGHSNIIVGNESGQDIAGTQNIAVGNQVDVSGSYNTFVGYQSGAAPGLSPGFATAIGYRAKASVDHSIILGDTDDTLMSVGIGTLNPSAKLEINGGSDDPFSVHTQTGERFRIHSNGKVVVNNFMSINTDSVKSGYELSVNGEIVCEEVLVQASEAWPDYVFEEEYALTSIDQLRNYIAREKHLPGIPKAEEIESEGIQLGDMQIKLLEKIEELTLYILQLEQRIRIIESAKP